MSIVLNFQLHEYYKCVFYNLCLNSENISFCKNKDFDMNY